MEGRCERHLFERARDLCGRCGGEFCSDCLVYSFGAARPPFCMPCAVERAGVRSNAAHRPAMSARQQRKLRKQRELALRRDKAGAPSRDQSPPPPSTPILPPPPASEPTTEPGLDWFAASNTAGPA